MTAAGITFQHVDGRTGEKYLIETLGSGALFFDYDIDGHLDLFVANGHLQENISLFSDSTYPQADLLFRNTRQQNGTYRFTDDSTEVGLTHLPKKVSRGAAFGDYDNDGDIDIFLNNSNQHVSEHSSQYFSFGRNARPLGKDQSVHFSLDIGSKIVV